MEPKVVNTLELKGMDKLREKLPAYPGRRLAIIPLQAIIGAGASFVFIIMLDITPRLFSDIAILTLIEPLLPLVGTLVIAALGLWLINRVWSKRDEMKERFGNLSYQKMFPTGLTGVSMVIVLVLHIFVSIRSLPPGPPVNDITIQWSRSLLQISGVSQEIDIWIRVILSVWFLLFGLATVRSSVLTFGMDYMAVVYLYFPEESEVQDHAIYSVIRHPTYLGGVLLGAAGLFFRFSVYSILLALIVYMAFRNQISREEKELVERFGEGYSDYKKRVPALLVRPRQFKLYLRFLREAF
jgi:protein-S-isoprenylcysteine O-methyltransferase Ste14